MGPPLGFNGGGGRSHPIWTPPNQDTPPPPRLSGGGGLKSSAKRPQPPSIRGRGRGHAKPRPSIHSPQRAHPHIWQPLQPRPLSLPIGPRRRDVSTKKSAQRGGGASPLATARGRCRRPARASRTYVRACVITERFQRVTHGPAPSGFAPPSGPHLSGSRRRGAPERIHRRKVLRFGRRGRTATGTGIVVPREALVHGPGAAGAAPPRQGCAEAYGRSSGQWHRWGGGGGGRFWALGPGSVP